MSRRRLVGLSIGQLGGPQWEYKDDDREIARRVLNTLGDRRLLWRDFSLEIEEHCVSSANEIRRQLGDHLDNPEIGHDLAVKIRLMQKLFRDFVSEVGPSGDEWGRRMTPIATDPLSVALGRLRGLMGVQIGILAAKYGLEVSDELATIVPDQEGWFWERFGS